MNLHTILALHPDQRLYVIQGGTDEGEPLVWFVKARDTNELQTALDTFHQANDQDAFYHLDWFELKGDFVRTVEQVIEDVRDSYDWVFENEDDEENEEPW